jgi:DNA-directed RNA polymerase specialized sigma24 family protein
VGAVEAALAAQGWTGERLVAEARRIVNDYLRGVPYLPEHRREELVSFVVEKACQAALKFDPERTSGRYGSRGGRHFDSWLCDVMAHRCIDWHRSKAEGNGDRRYGFDNRIVLYAEPEDHADEAELDLERYLSADRVQRWQEAAAIVELALAEFIVVSLDAASAAVRRQSASSTSDQSV